MNRTYDRIIIIGAGAAGLSAALELAKNKIHCILVSDLASERAQTVMAKGGVNAACERTGDSPALHAEETMEAGRGIADPEAALAMAEAAPKIIEMLHEAGMLFTLNEDGVPAVHEFGGQSKERTYYCASSTGKQLMHTLIAAARRFESEGTIERMMGWSYLRLIYQDGVAYGCSVMSRITGEIRNLYGKVIIASGGLGGMFGKSTGSVQNTGNVSANLFASGVRFANGEFIQFHPTTARLRGKNLLISEGARSEGGRLFVIRENKPYYFMEEKYPEHGNLMPRDVISREEWHWMKAGYPVFLDLRHLGEDVLQERLPGVMEDCRRYLGLNPAEEPIPIEPGIHYFMGGIWVDRGHRTSMKNLYAIGECDSQYHGANRLGGNSLLSALYSGEVVCQSILTDGAALEVPENLLLSSSQPDGVTERKTPESGLKTEHESGVLHNPGISSGPETEGETTCTRRDIPGSYMDNMTALRRILLRGLGIVREESTLQKALREINELQNQIASTTDSTASPVENRSLADCCLLGKALLLSADARKESRGAHSRSDYPEELPEYEKQTIAEYTDGKIEIYFRKAGEADEH